MPSISQFLCFLVISTIFFINNQDILAAESHQHRDPLSILLSFNFANGGNHYFGNDSTRPTGKNIQITMLDTGIQYRHPVFFHQQQKSHAKKKKQFPKKDNCHNFAGTTSNTFDDDHHSQNLPCIDHVGHGTFVAGVLIGDTRLCSSASAKRSGPIAPNASLLVAKVFSDTAMSYTSHIVDALNFILTRKTMQNVLWELSSSPEKFLKKHSSINFLTLLTLSTGSSDYMDEPFNAKIDELLAAGITVVTAAGNNHGLKRFGGEGVLNPADRLGVIAVGGILHELKFANPADGDSLELAEATAGGLTNVNHHQHEFRLFKPDVVTFSEKIYGAKLSGGCGVSSGTSVAAPIVTGVLALAHEKLIRLRKIMPNPGISKILIWKSSWMPKQTRRNEGNKKSFSTMKSDSELLDTFESEFANSFYGAGSGLLNPEELIRLAVETEYFDIAFHPPHLDFYTNNEDFKNVLSTEFLPLSRVQLPIYSSKNLAMTVSVAIGESPSAKLFFSGNVELRTKDSKWIKLNSQIHGFNVEVKPMKEKAKRASNKNHATVIDIFPYVGAFQIIFEAVELNSQDFYKARKELFDDDVSDKGAEFITVGKIHLTLKMPDSNKIKNVEYSFSISHQVLPPPREQRILWISHRNLHWPKSFVASDDVHPSMLFPRENNNNNENFLHHADFFEFSSDDPLGGSPTSILLYKLITCENNYFVDVLNDNNNHNYENSILQNATLLRQRFSAIILYDPEDYFTPKEYEVLFDALMPSRNDNEESEPAVNLIVVSDWYSHDLMKHHHFEKNNPDRINIAKKSYSKKSQKTLEPERLVMAGSNVPSLNFFLEPIFGIKLIANSVFSLELHDDALDNHNECLDRMNKGKLLGFSNDNKFHAVYPTTSMSAVVPSTDVDKNRKIEFYGPRSTSEDDCSFIATKWSSSTNKNNPRFILSEEILPEKFKNIFPMIALVENNKKNRAAIVSDSSCFTFQHKPNGINPCVSLFKALVDFAVAGFKNEDFFNSRHEIKNELVEEFAKDLNERKLTREILADAEMRRRFAMEDLMVNSSKILKKFFLNIN